MNRGSVVRRKWLVAVTLFTIASFGAVGARAESLERSGSASETARPGDRVVGAGSGTGVGLDVVTLTVADDARQICILRGTRVRVTLSVEAQAYPDPQNWWTPVVADDPAPTRLPNTILPVRGATVAGFRAERSPGRSRAPSWTFWPSNLTMRTVWGPERPTRGMSHQDPERPTRRIDHRP
jgi:hypothetical protein